MANARARIRIPEEEQRALLASARTLQVATSGRDGQPHLVPMWFAVDSEGLIVFTTYGSSQKVRNLRRDPRITVLVEDGTSYEELRGVAIEGEAELIADPERTREVMRLVGQKYGGRTGQAGRSADARQRAFEKRVVVRVHPRRVRSWDHRRLAGA